MYCNVARYVSAWLTTDMGHRHSRLSTDGEEPPRRPPSPSSHEKTQCPSCGQRQLTTINVDDELPVSVCSGCGRIYGIDDSMDAEFLAQLRQDDEFRQDFHMTAITCDQCRNNDVYRFVVVEGPHLDRLSVRCMECSSVSDIPLKDWETEGPDDDVDGLPVAEVHDDSGSLWDDADSGYDVDSEEDPDVANCRDDAGDVLLFNCIRCGNNEVECFRTHFDVATGDLSMVTCMDCGQQKAIESFFGVECWHCGNGRKELFERHVDDYGRITRLLCFVCDTRLHLPGQTSPRKDAGPKKLQHSSRTFGNLERETAKVVRRVGLGWTKIEDLRHVQRGDHIAWHKWYAIWHHGIVVDVPDGGRELTVIHSSGDIVKLDGHFASVRLETIDVNPKKEDFYRIDYPAGDTYPVDQVVQRACDRLGEAKYNPFTNNCEHFARWCKTGRAKSGQVHTFEDRVKLALKSAATKAAHEVAADGFEGLVTGSLGTLGKIGARGIRHRAGQLFGTTSGVIRNVKCGALACTVGINLGLEAAMFTKDALVAYRKYKSGAISRDDFRRALGKLGCESVGGVLFSTGTAILGQIAIPVPLVGSIVGSVLGNLIGRYLGAVIGKKVAAIKPESAKTQ